MKLVLFMINFFGGGRGAGDASKSVLVDLSYISPAGIDGVDVYAFRLLEALETIDSPLKLSLLVTEANEALVAERLPGYARLRASSWALPFSGKLWSFNSFPFSFYVNRLLRKHHFSVLFSPYLHTNAICTRRVPHKGVLHDAQFHILNRQKGLKGWVYNRLRRRTLRAVPHIVTISHSARASIVQELPFVREPEAVIYNSVPVIEAGEIPASVAEDSYILYVNTLMPYKNAETLVRAFALIQEECEHRLLIKARSTDYWREVIVPLMHRLGVTERVTLLEEDFSDAQMSALYRGAAVFLSTSTMEGFGYTPIEAAIHRVPVICSSLDSLLETTQRQVIYYSPIRDPQALAEKLREVLQKPPSPAALEKTAEQLQQTYAGSRQARAFANYLMKI